MMSLIVAGLKRLGALRQPIAKNIKIASAPQ
jgi:hypothetical protein